MREYTEVYKNFILYHERKMKKWLNLIAFTVLLSTNVLTPITYAQSGESAEILGATITETIVEEDQQHKAEVNPEPVKESANQETTKEDSQTTIDIVSGTVDEYKENRAQELDNKEGDADTPEENKSDEIWEEVVESESDDSLSPMQWEDNILDTEDSIQSLEDDEMGWIIHENWIIKISYGNNEIWLKDRNVGADDVRWSWNYYFRWNNGYATYDEMNFDEEWRSTWISEIAVSRWFIQWWKIGDDNAWWKKWNNENPCTGYWEYLPTPEDWRNLLEIWWNINEHELSGGVESTYNYEWTDYSLYAYWLYMDDTWRDKLYSDLLIPVWWWIEATCLNEETQTDESCFQWYNDWMVLRSSQDEEWNIWIYDAGDIEYSHYNVQLATEGGLNNRNAFPVRCFVMLNPVTVTYVLWENEEIEQTLEAWKTISPIDTPERDGYYFLGWYQDPSYAWEAFDFSTPIEENITLYAKRVHIICNDEDITYTDTNWNVFEWMGTITFTDGVRSITMLDRNLWATARLGDSEWDSNGYYFQWWNNYGFLPWDNEVVEEQVDVTWYGWNNPYVRDVFVANSKSWIATSETEYADNLWWWLDDYRDNTWASSIWHDYMRQWPCPEWYHVPSGWEWLELILLWSDYRPSNDVLAIDTAKYANYIDFASGLLLPKAGKMNYEWYSLWEEGGTGPSSVNELTVSNRKKNIYLWTSSPYYRFSWSESALYWSRRLFIAKWAKAQSSVERAYWFPVRCFKDSYIEWDEPLVLSYDTRWGSAIQAQTIPEWENGYLPGYTTHRTWYTLLWWYDNLGELELDENKITNRTMKNDLSENGVVTIYARWNDDHVVTFKDHDGSVIKVVLVRNWENAQSPANPTREGYKFTGWDKDLNNVTEDMEVTAQYSSSSNGWYSWWWGSASKPDKSHNSVDDKEISDTKNSLEKVEEQPSQWKTLDTDSPYKETINAHQWAYQQWLTKYKNISEARMDEPLNRSEMAKISSIFATQMLNKAPNEEKKEFCSQYPDLWKVEDDMKLFIIESCELWYMGYESNWIDALARFRPYTPVTVAEAATILSRIVRWNENAMNWKDWYKWHLYATYNHGLLDDVIDPTTRNITRREAYTMLYRLIKNS